MLDNHELGAKAAGRPSVINEVVLSKLRAVLQKGLSIKKACQFAGIGEKTFYRHYNNDSEFRQLVEDCRNYVTLFAGEVVADDIVINKNVSTAKWWLERKEPNEFNNQAAITQINTQNNQNSTYISIPDANLKKWAEENEIGKLSVEQVSRILGYSAEE